MPRKSLNQEEAEQIFEEGGCKLIGKYTGCNKPVEYICECGTVSKIAINSFKKGTRCRKCGIIKMLSSRTGDFRTLTYEYVKQYFEDHNCKLLEKIYKNSKTKMKYICSCGNISSISFDNFQQGHRCSKCGLEKLSEKFKLNFDYVKQYFEENNCKLISNEYTNSNLLLEYECAEGHTSKITFGSFKQGHRCMKCLSEKKSGENNLFWNPNREEVKNNREYSIKFRNILRHCLERIGKSKEDCTHKILGYSAKQLQEHIENHLNWVNVKNGKWHIDHIFPVKAFVEHGILDPKIINDLDNLQPLSQFDNISKSDNYVEKEFINYCKTHGVAINVN